LIIYKKKKKKKKKKKLDCSLQVMFSTNKGQAYATTRAIISAMIYVVVLTLLK
jgi:hypothetical protein